ncbi:hypothetical protein CEB3_c33980 [Peptococcaceae bacterium CEB3]|nr:hypothetical protein CEB3_c33980 [Peptococcaceae bacterium CEB3]
MAVEESRRNLKINDCYRVDGTELDGEHVAVDQARRDGQLPRK